MTLREIIDRAIASCGTPGHPGNQGALAKRMGILSWAVSQWRLGISFPAPDREALLAELAGVEPAIVKDAIWEARRAKWEARRPRPGGPDVAFSWPRFGPAKAQGHRRHRVHAHAGGTR